MKTKTVIISLGGSLVSPDGLDLNYLKKFKKLILDFVKKGNRAVIIVGGGSLARNYIEAARKLNRSAITLNLHWIGVRATRLNAELVKTMFGDIAYDETIFYRDQFPKKNFNVLVAGGGNPGGSTDGNAVFMARSAKAASIINLSNIDYVYDRDPRKFSDAKKIKSISWKAFRKMTGNKITPGGNYPFDPKASKMAQNDGIEVVIMNGKNLTNLKNYLSGKDFKGTLIG